MSLAGSGSRKRKAPRKAAGKRSGTRLNGTTATHSEGFEREKERSLHFLKMAQAHIDRGNCVTATDNLIDGERRFFAAMVENEYGAHKSMTELNSAVERTERSFKSKCIYR